VQPFLGLAVELRRAGHDVRLAAPYRFAGLVAQYSVPFAPLPGDPEEMSAFVNDVRGNLVGAARGMLHYVLSIAEPVLRAAFDACTDTDLVVHSFFFTTFVHALARERKIPDVSVQLVPLFMPTRTFPMVALPAIPPGAVSLFTHRLTTWVFRRAMRVGLTRLRRVAPGIVGKSLAWPFDPSRRGATPLLFAFSPSVLPRPADWTAPGVHIPGYFFLEAPEAYSAPRDVMDFIAAGEPPVCVTFGSMVNRESARISAIVRAALSMTRQRGILLTGWAGENHVRREPGVLSLEAAPHDWLFPQCRSVVHHGGVGTTAAALLAGVPSIIIPHGIDQAFWGRRVAAAGAGPAPISLSRLSVETLSAAFLRANRASLQLRAQEIGRTIRAEQGVREAVRLIENHAAAFRRRVSG
jgi:sterol 3beta-glucosyltransferase